MRSVSRLSIPRSGSYRATLCSPLSTTVVTSGTVSVVSAMFVARITRGAAGRLERGILLVAAEAAVQRQDDDAGHRRDARQPVGRAPDLGRAGQEAQHRRRRRRS